MTMKRMLMAMIWAGAVAVGAAEPTPAKVGEAAPEFQLPDLAGQSRTLSEFKGKYVVLEWTNYDCPFVKKHYGSGNMQALQKASAAKGVIWLSINSSAAGKQGHYTAEEWAKQVAAREAAPAAVLLDGDGTVGRRYGAKTTPHIFIINPEGVLIYGGAIDSNSSPDPKTIPGAVNYVHKTLDAALAGKPVEPAATQPYGCSVKY